MKKAVVIRENIHDEFFPCAIVHEDGSVEGNDSLEKEIKERGLFSREKEKIVKNGEDLLNAILQKYNSGYYAAEMIDDDE